MLALPELGIYFHEAAHGDGTTDALLTMPPDIDVPTAAQAELGAALVRSALAQGNRDPVLKTLIGQLMSALAGVTPPNEPELTDDEWGNAGEIPGEAGDYWYQQRGPSGQWGKQHLVLLHANGRIDAIGWHLLADMARRKRQASRFRRRGPTETK